MAVKIIDLKAVDQALNTHLIDSARLREKLVNSLTILKRSYNSTCASAVKSLKAQSKAINNDRKDRKSKAQQAHFQGLRSAGGSSFETYQAKLTSIDNDCDAQIEKARGATEQTMTEAAEQFSSDSQGIITQYQGDLSDCVDKLATEHP